jgi:transmembrane sensor
MRMQEKKMDKNYYQKLCHKSISGNINEIEIAQLDKWLAESEINREEFNNLKKIWLDTTPTETFQIPDAEMEWNNLNRKIKVLETDSISEKRIFSNLQSHIKSFMLPGWKPALTSLIVFICIIAGFFIMKQQTPEQQLINISTANKEHREIQLPDGSTALLNNGSTIKYLRPFNNNSRDVYLTGEAFFKVTKNTIPFNILSFNAKVSVLGTQFDVWVRDGKTRVIVKEGKVKLASLNSSSKSVLLSANQTSSIVDGSSPFLPKEIDWQYLLGWMKGRLVFDRTPLNEVADELERTYNVKIILAGDSLRRNTISGSFNNYNIDTVLSMICLALDLKYEKQPDSYLIESKGSKN